MSISVSMLVDLFRQRIDRILQAAGTFLKRHDRLQCKAMVGAHRSGGLERRTVSFGGARPRLRRSVRMSATATRRPLLVNPFPSIQLVPAGVVPRCHDYQVSPLATLTRVNDFR